jgi:hypothetical protein
MKMKFVCGNENVMGKLMNSYIKIFSTVTLFTFYSCTSSTDTKNNVTKDTLSLSNNKLEKRIFGERLNIAGDFVGDGKKDTIFESYISDLTGEETFKTFDSTNWEENIGLLIKNNPTSRLYSNIKGLHTFIVTKESQQAGISMLENLGDLNNDKGDEIGYVINWVDYSNLNTYHILTFAQG